MNTDQLKLTTEIMSGGKNTIILDDMGMPSVVVKIPKMTYAELGLGSSDAIFPAFIVGEKILEEIYISKYLNIVENDRAYSLPNQDPRANISFDAARATCKNKGAGWHLMTLPERALLAWWSKKNGTMPRGNNNYGKDIEKSHEKGHVTYKYASGENTLDGRTAAGSGPATWSHDWTNEGVFDLNGNVWEWCDGLKINNGIAHLMRNNNFEDLETAWINTGVNIVNGMNSGQSIATLREGAIPGAPGQLWESLAIPATTTSSTSTEFGGDGYWFNGEEERMMLVGGHWLDGLRSGVFASLLSYSRASSDHNVGFRAAFASL